jgi:hypothetical protein
MPVVDFNDLCVLSGIYFLSDQERHVVESNLPTPDDDEDGVKDLLACYIAPRLRSLEKQYPGYLERLKATLRYCLTTRRFPAVEVYEAEEPLIDPPADSFKYYEWAWEVLFRGQEWTLPSLEGFIEKV